MRLYSEADTWIETHVPAVLRRWEMLSLAAWQWIGIVVVLAIAFVMGHVLGLALISLLLRLLDHAKSWSHAFVKELGKPGRLLLFAVTLGVLSPYLLLPASMELVVTHVQSSLFIFTLAWVLIVLLRVGTRTYVEALPEDTEAELRNRGLRTRITGIRRIGTVVIGTIATGVMLLQFEVVRSVGVSLLASAGIVGVLVGFAAQRTLGGLISGLEVSITEPLRMGDIVAFDGAEGVVERIYFTYIVVRMGDDRRLIVPVQSLMAKPFENLTLIGADLIVTVDVFVDFEAPIDAIRTEFQRLCKDAPDWDHRQSTMVVAELTDRAMKLRGIATVDNASKAAALRGKLREGLVRYLQTLDGGRHLPKARAATVN
jgi:small-conductance mechanosensitive channel